MGAVCSLTYSTIAWVMSVVKGPVENVEYNLAGDSTATIVFGTFSAMSTMVFAYGGARLDGGWWDNGPGMWGFRGVSNPFWVCFLL